ncbi:MAG: hypothetical protein AAB618_02580 [Patescibacteria group bacterium]
MRYLLLTLVLLTSVSFAYAYNPIPAEPTEAYSLIEIEGDPYVERSYLGDLEDAPDMYELKTDVAITLKMQVMQRSNKKAQPFGLIIVRQNDIDGGVAEIVRQNEPLEKWTKERSQMLGMRFLTAPVLEKEITPGTYHIEVSTPDNKGSYMLLVGEEPVSSGYFKALAQIFKTQHHFGFTPFHLIFSSYIYLTLVIIGIGYGSYRLKRYRKEKYDQLT